jgi:hypothetical protein
VPRPALWLTGRRLSRMLPRVSCSGKKGFLAGVRSCFSSPLRLPAKSVRKRLLLAPRVAYLPQGSTASPSLETGRTTAGVKLTAAQGASLLPPIGTCGPGRLSNLVKVCGTCRQEQRREPCASSNCRDGPTSCLTARSPAAYSDCGSVPDLRYFREGEVPFLAEAIHGQAATRRILPAGPSPPGSVLCSQGSQ